MTAVAELVHEEEIVEPSKNLMALAVLLRAASNAPGAWNVPAAGFNSGLVSGARSKARSSVVADLERFAKRVRLAEEFVRNEGFYSPPKPELMSDDFVFMGPVVGPLNVKDFLGTVGTFKVYDAFPDLKVDLAPFTQDPVDPDRFWTIMRVAGTHTAPLNAGSQMIPATGKRMEIGPQAVSVTFDSEDKVARLTGGYITDVRDGTTGGAGAMFAVLKSVGAKGTPRPGGKTFKFLNWLGAKMKDFPKGRSHRDDLPSKWASLGRSYGLRTVDAWSN